MTTPLYPLLFKPIYKDYVWGGRRIPVLYNREPQPGLCAESWEVADRPEGMSVVTNGPLAGRTLHELAADLRETLIGTALPGPRFPLLIKIIDASERLSLQVHPDDATAARYGGEAKTEMWYVLAAEPGAQVLAGLAAACDAQRFTQALRTQQVEPLLQAVPVQAGDAVYVPGGRIHAIGQGCLLLEVQQNSDTTYRIYDWGRVGHDGKPRPLHLTEALRVIDWQDTRPPKVPAVPLPAPAPNAHWEIVRSPYFRIVRLHLQATETTTNDGRSFHALFVESGRIRMRTSDFVQEAGPGASCLLPAAVSAYELTSLSPGTVVLRIGVV